MNIEEIRIIVSQSKSFRNAAKKLKINHQKLKKICVKNDIDISHFTFNKNERFVNQQFNMLVIKEILPKKLDQKKSRINCLSQCKLCDGFKIARLDSVIGLQYYSCGCHHKVRPNITGELNPSFKGIGEIRAHHYEQIKTSASKRNIEFNIDKDYLWKLYLSQDKKCSLTGIPIQFGRIYFKYETTASLDRIDSSKGYIEGNVQWVHKLVNLMKNSISQKNFIEICCLVADNHKHIPEYHYIQMLSQ